MRLCSTYNVLENFPSSLWNEYVNVLVWIFPGADTEDGFKWKYLRSGEETSQS